MTKTVLTFGLISGTVLVLMMCITVPLYHQGKIDGSNSEIIGYTTMVAASLAIFFGIRSYRENTGGTITFGRAFKVGILIALIAAAMYVIAWEIIYFNFLPDFVDKYAAATLEKMKAAGASAEKLLAEEKKMEEFKRLYANPLFNVGMTFMEVFPIGLLVTLISSAILRKKPAAELVADPSR